MNAWNSANIRIIGCIELLLLNLFYRKTVQDLYIKTFLFELFHLRRIQKFIVLFEILQGVSFKKYQQAFAVTFICIPLTLLFFLLLSYYLLRIITHSPHCQVVPDCDRHCRSSKYIFSHSFKCDSLFIDIVYLLECATTDSAIIENISRNNAIPVHSPSDESLIITIELVIAIPNAITHTIGSFSLLFILFLYSV